MPRNPRCAARGCAPRRRWACHLRAAGKGEAPVGCIDRCDEFLSAEASSEELVLVQLTASGPATSRRRKPSSSRTATPTSAALSYLLPRASRARTKEVFLLTEPLTFPPRSCT